ncbi:UbiH/UbiF/VisC/COQ6 family ubiquinone biosynthesis hydroxylase [Thiohalorhabdus sp.]|uniref:UbiH/UbiF/VisC/COQ6 family ubiquinone biosynthesis hydroxylase n=1 Tax=Thiohalorhabdus sp. TaxID=3094134 RepID=UPI002FC31D10
MSEPFDAAVVGGGMVGAVAAVALRRQGLSVGLIERGRPPEGPGQPGDPERVSAVSEGSRRILTDLGLWPAIADSEPAAIETIEVTDGGRGGRVLMDRDEAGVDALGYVVANRRIVASAWEAVRADPGIVVHAPAGVADWQWQDRGVRLQLEGEGGGQTLSTRLVIGADSEHSATRAAARIGMRGWHHNRYALVATVETERPLAGRAFERFLPEGPLAFLPLGGATASIVWTLTPSAANRALNWDQATLLSHIQDRFGPALGGLQHVGGRATFPLALRLARRFTEKRTALVGNAAHLLHPVAGQGLNLGLRDVQALAEEAGAARSCDWDPGNTAVLNRYERARWGDTARVMAFTEGLNRLFANDWAPAVGLRQLGLSVVGQSRPLKRILMNQAMGLAGRDRHTQGIGNGKVSR